MAAHAGDIADALERVRAEYAEMPGLCLTTTQASRLLGLDHEMCMALLGVLVGARILRRRPDGAFVRADSGAC